jgi:hypothetical protein
LQWTSLRVWSAYLPFHHLFTRRVALVFLDYVALIKYTCYVLLYLEVCIIYSLQQVYIIDIRGCQEVYCVAGSKQVPQIAWSPSVTTTTTRAVVGVVAAVIQAVPPAVSQRPSCSTRWVIYLYCCLQLNRHNIRTCFKPLHADRYYINCKFALYI